MNAVFEFSLTIIMELIVKLDKKELIKIIFKYIIVAIMDYNHRTQIRKQLHL
jgi:hypothetical protein